MQHNAYSYSKTQAELQAWRFYQSKSLNHYSLITLLPGTTLGTLVCMFVFCMFVVQSVSVCVCFYCLSVCVYESVCRSARIFFSVCLCTCQSVCVFVCLFVFFNYVCLDICLYLNNQYDMIRYDRSQYRRGEYTWLERNHYS